MKRKLFIIITIYLQSCIANSNMAFYDRKAWHDDSLACLGKRRLIYDTLLKNKDKFIGQFDKKIEYYFGLPNITQVSDTAKRYYYFVDKGPQCVYVNRNGYDTLEVEVMCVFFDVKNKVSDIRGMKP